MPKKKPKAQNSQAAARIQYSRRDALDAVRAALSDNGRLFVSQHARERMQERDITIRQIRTVLQLARMTEEPHADVRGRWSCRFEGYAAGEGLGVAVGLSFHDDGTTVVVVTAFRTNNYR